jgi:hypothetical protein
MTLQVKAGRTPLAAARREAGQRRRLALVLDAAG